MRPLAGFHEYYNSEDFDANEDPSWVSAQVVAPIVAELFKPKSIVRRRVRGRGVVTGVPRPRDRRTDGR